MLLHILSLTLPPPPKADLPIAISTPVGLYPLPCAPLRILCLHMDGWTENLRLNTRLLFTRCGTTQVPYDGRPVEYRCCSLLNAGEKIVKCRCCGNFGPISGGKN